MRLILGIILGILITIGGAYVHDSARSPAGATAAERPMVNWDVVNENFRALRTRIMTEWNKLTG